MKRLILLLILPLSIVFGQNVLRVEDTQAAPGDTNIAVQVALINPTDAVAGIQFSLHYDTTMVNLIDVQAGSRLSGTSFTISSNAQGDSVNVVIISLSGDSLLPDSGDIAVLHFNSTSNVQGGDSLVLSLTNIVLSSPQGSHLPVTGENGVLRFIIQPRAFVIVSADTVECGQTAFVLLRLNNPQDAVSGIQFTLTFDSSYVTFDSLIAGLSNFTYSTNNFGDSVKVVILSLSGDSILPPGCDLGTIMFYVSSSANPNDSIPINIRDVVVSNPQASHIPSEGIGGYIGISSVPPDIYSPTGYLDTRTFDLIWGNVTGASLYFVELSSNSDFTTLIDSATVGDTVKQFSVFQDGAFYVRVRSITSKGYISNWSDIDSFVVDVTSPGVVNLLQPVDGAMLNNDTIVFDWADVVDSTSGILGYWIQISVDSAFSTSDSYFVSVSETTLVLSDTTYYWRVKAIDRAGNEGEWSEIWSFTVDTQVPNVPSLISPIGGEWLTDTVVTLEWSEVTKELKGVKSSPVHYVVDIMRGGNSIVYDTVDTNMYGVVLGEGRYSWRVKAFDEAGNESNWSSVDSFGVDITPPEPVSLISPADSTILNTSRISFDWSDGVDSTSGVAGYWIEVSTNESFAGVDSSFVNVSETTMVLSDTTWYWRVKAVDNAGNEGDWSDVWQFTIDTEAPGAPVLMFPIGNVWLDNDTVTFVWSKVSLKTIKDEKSTPVMYMLEVDGNVVDTAIIDTIYTLVVGEGNHNWRVRAYDLAGNISQWSDMGQFGVDTSAPVIDSLTTIMDTVRSVGPWVINAWAEDAYSGIDNVQLIYQIDTGWDTVAMADSGNGRWVGEIPAITDSLAHNIVYFVEVTDSVGNSSVSDTISFVAIEVEEDNYWGKVELVIPSIVTKRGMEIEYNVPGNRKFVVRMYDISGREIWRENLELTGKGTKKLNLKVREGVYFISIEGTGNVIKRRLIVIRE